jgi:hypothetical protein
VDDLPSARSEASIADGTDQATDRTHERIDEHIAERTAEPEVVSNLMVARHVVRRLGPGVTGWVGDLLAT